jgi:hypothetical protein
VPPVASWIGSTFQRSAYTVTAHGQIRDELHVVDRLDGELDEGDILIIEKAYRDNHDANGEWQQKAVILISRKQTAR